MTGYGKGESPFGNGTLTVEIRSVNHRYGEISVKLPRKFMAFENELKKTVAASLKRGKIEVFIQIGAAGNATTQPEINLPLAHSYYQLFAALKENLGLTEEIGLGLIAAQKDVISLTDSDTGEVSSSQELFDALQQAVTSIDQMRRLEGDALEADLLKRREYLGGIIKAVAERAPRVVTAYALKLQERLKQLTGEGGLPEERVAQEIAIMADRSDITEELVRFDSHMIQFDLTLKSEEPVGRKLDFLLQEINREVNTIGSKANDADIAALVVEMKAELEKIREQVQNIE
jgi:uncharacterized protein (TIGR00255 family)